MKHSSTSAITQAKRLFSKAMFLHQKNRFHDAILCYKQVLQLMPKQPDALHMLGVVAFQQNDFSAAVDWMTQAYSIQPTNSTLLFNLGNAQRAIGNLIDAENMYLAALKFSSENENVEVLKNLGNVYKERNEFQNAVSIYEKILARHPEHEYTRMNKALALLTMGNLYEGWPLYESRITIEKVDENRILNMPMVPAWHGESLEKPLLVLAEQGLGDQIFYGALLSDLQRSGITCVVCMDARLLDLFERSFPSMQFFHAAELPDCSNQQLLFGAQIHIASLGKFFRNQASDFKNVLSPYLLADKNAARLLRIKMQNNGKLVCGISWDSKHIENGRTKRITLQQLLPALQIPNVHFVDLQYGDTQSQRDELASVHGVRIQCFEDIDNFHHIDKLASLIEACDVVVTVSNSTAHLAAALGKPTVVMLAHHTPLWYWHQESMSSPWYPTVTLLRQAQPAQWEPVVSQVAAILNGLVNPT